MSLWCRNTSFALAGSAKLLRYTHIYTCGSIYVHVYVCVYIMLVRVYVSMCVCVCVCVQIMYYRNHLYSSSVLDLHSCITDMYSGVLQICTAVCSYAYIPSCITFPTVIIFTAYQIQICIAVLQICTVV